MKERRRVYIINKRYQWKFVAAFTALTVTGILASTLMVYFMIKTGIQENLYRSHLKIMSLSQIVIPVTAKISLLFFILGAILLSALSYYFSKKVKRLEASMLEGLIKIKEGNLKVQFKIGQKEEFPNLETQMNLMAETIRDDVARLKILSGDLEGLLDEPKLNIDKIKEITGKMSNFPAG